MWYHCKYFFSAYNWSRLAQRDTCGGFWLEWRYSVQSWWVLCSLCLSQAGEGLKSPHERSVRSVQDWATYHSAQWALLGPGLVFPVGTQVQINVDGPNEIFVGFVCTPESIYLSKIHFFPKLYTWISPVSFHSLFRERKAARTHCFYDNTKHLRISIESLQVARQDIVGFHILVLPQQNFKIFVLCLGEIRFFCCFCPCRYSISESLRIQMLWETRTLFLPLRKKLCHSSCPGVADPTKALSPHQV